MTKKVLLVLVLASVIAGGVWAQDEAESGSSGKKGGIPLTVGGGFRYDSTKYEIAGSSASAPKTALVYGGVGFFGFLDANFAVLKVGMTFGDYELTYDGESLGDPNKLSYLDVDLLGKWTFGPVLGGKLLWYPMLGVGYMACLSSDSERLETADLGRFMIEGGIGADYAITPKLGIRADLTLGLLGTAQVEKDFGGGQPSSMAIKFDLAVSYKLK
jgi:hypothetical protein